MLALAGIPAPPPGTFEPFLLNACAALAIVALLLTIALAARNLFGRTPPLHIELEAVDKRVASCATKEQLSELEKRLLTSREFEDYKAERLKDIKRMEDGIGSLTRTLDSYSASNYRGRKALHKQANSHGEAIAFIAGRMERGGEHVQQIIARGRSADEEGGEG